jgi:hypothetical protein
MSAASGEVVLALPRGGHARVIRSGFLGLSFEYRAVEAYAGSDPQAIDPVFEQLVDNLTPGQTPIIRIGGDSTDWTWWRVPHMRRPPGVSYTISKPWLADAAATTAALGARVILGIDFEADSARLGAAEVRALERALGPSSVLAIEPGNEPELYRSWGWYCSAAGREVAGRPRSYDFSAFLRDYSTFIRALPSGPIAGPAVGSDNWFRDLPEFLAAEPMVRLVTLHRYPLQNYVAPTNPKYPSVSNLLSDASSQGLAASVAPYARLAHARHLPLRIDEMNNVSAGIAPGVADAFDSALWVMDALFQMANVGVDGVNIHTFPGSAYELFRFEQISGAWEGYVSPEYYGLMMFAQAAPPHSRLFHLPAPRGASIRAWATVAPDRQTRVVLINDGSDSQTVVLRAPGAAGTASVERLEAPGPESVSGVTLGGQTFGPQTATGLLTGSPADDTVSANAGSYTVALPAASAAMLTIPAEGSTGSRP